ncbi:hypothetical protein IH992_25430 [Candidatus Poribacteria bacterium]|nr:hypothetical protein [Candidatus Poribacteria bacterium]
MEKPITTPKRRGRRVGSTAKPRWEQIFENATTEEIAAVLYLLPKGVQAKSSPIP